jgi:uncharacterized protein (TIGR02271 family)
MSRTVTALYDTRAEAEAARQRLSSSVDVKSARVIDQNSTGSGSGRHALDDVYMSHEDRHAYGEGLRRGGFLLCAEVDSDEDSQKIVRLLEETSSVDLDERQQGWQREGWSPQLAAGTQAGTASTAGSGLGMTGTAGTAGAATSGTRNTGSTVEEEHIPIVEEELRIGKRVVERGGARVRTYVREVPVHEQVTLREEHVQVERRPVNQPLSGTDVNLGDALQERSFEMRETAEEAVVQKVANVREELVVSKTAEERVEQIDDTVRHTEVEVDQGGTRTDGDRSAFGGFNNGGSGTSQSDSERSRPEFERNNDRR